MHINHILVTTDLSEESFRPYASIAEIARNRGARVTLLHVVDETPIVSPGAPLAPPVTSPRLGERMEAARVKITEHGDVFGEVPVAHDVIAGTNVAGSIASHAKEIGADMIAVSTHGRSGFRRLILGSVAEELLRKSPVPVLAFPRVRE